MKLQDNLKKLKGQFTVAISTEKSYLSTIIDIIVFFLEKKDKHIVCLTLEHPAYDIHAAVELRTKTDKLFFVDAISIFKDYGLPYKNFESVNSPDLVDDIWVAINMELLKRKEKNEDAIVILHNVVSLSNHIGIDDTILFLGPLMQQLKENKVSIIVTSGVVGNSVDKNLFHNLVDKVIQA